MKSETEPTSASGKFWHGIREWPGDRKDHVFLANAVLQVGRAYYGDAWGDYEGFVGHIDATLPAAAHFQPHLPDDVRARTKSIGQAQLRFKHAKSLVANALADRELEFALRHVDGGEFIPQRTDLQPRASRFGHELWNIDDHEHRFAFCQIDLENPFAKRPVGKWFVFVTRASLDAFSAKVRSSRLPEPEERKTDSQTDPVVTLLVSQYLHIMLATCSRVKVAPDTMPTVAAMEAEIKNTWETLYRDINYSPTLAAKMATLCRSFGSQSGKARRNGDGPFKSIKIIGL